MASTNEILLLGAGELGTAFLKQLSDLPNTHITIGVRIPSKYEHLNSSIVAIIALDTTTPTSQLSRTFAEYDTIISCTGFGQPAGTVIKLAHDVLEAGKMRDESGKGKIWFFPWQWGVDYDITGDGEGLMPLFGEQVDVRNLLREKAGEFNVKWTIVSTGIFMSFLFEDFWGVVERNDDRFKVRGLRSLGHKVTVTEVEDIARVVAKIVAGDVESEDRIVYAAGDTISYAGLADTLQKVTGRKVDREDWPVRQLQDDLSNDPENLIRKYRVVFAGNGVWWDKGLTVNYQLSMPVTDIETYIKMEF